MECETYCNCDFENMYMYPDLIVRTLDGQDIRVNSAVVVGSGLLQEMVQKRLKHVQVPPGQALDLRKGKEPTFGITMAEWILLQRFMGLHLDQVQYAC